MNPIMTMCKSCKEEESVGGILEEPDVASRQSAGLRTSKTDSFEEIVMIKDNSGKRSNKVCKDSFLVAPLVVKVREYAVKDVIIDLDDRFLVKNDDRESEVYHVYPLKEINIDDLLKPPSYAEFLKEKVLDERDVKIKEATAKHVEEMKAIDDWKCRQNIKRKRRRKECLESRLRRIKLEEELTEAQMLEIFNKNSKYLMEIKCGKIKSERHQAFHKGGHARWSLNIKVYDGCFSDEIINASLNEIDKMTGLEPKEIILNADYNWKVLLPEFLIKVYFSEVLNLMYEVFFPSQVYMEFFGFSEKNLAEQRMYQTPVRAKDQSDESDYMVFCCFYM